MAIVDLLIQRYHPGNTFLSLHGLAINDSDLPLLTQFLLANPHIKILGVKETKITQQGAHNLLLACDLDRVNHDDGNLVRTLARGSLEFFYTADQKVLQVRLVDEHARIITNLAHIEFCGSRISLCPRNKGSGNDEILKAVSHRFAQINPYYSYLIIDDFTLDYTHLDISIDDEAVLRSDFINALCSHIDINADSLARLKQQLQQHGFTLPAPEDSNRLFAPFVRYCGGDTAFWGIKFWPEADHLLAKFPKVTLFPDFDRSILEIQFTGDEDNVFSSEIISRLQQKFADNAREPLLAGESGAIEPVGIRFEGGELQRYFDELILTLQQCLPVLDRDLEQFNLAWSERINRYKPDFRLAGKIPGLFGVKGGLAASTQSDNPTGVVVRGRFS